MKPPESEAKPEPQRVVVVGVVNGGQVYAAVYTDEQAQDAFLSCHRDHPGERILTRDAREHALAQGFTVQG